MWCVRVGSQGISGLFNYCNLLLKHKQSAAVRAPAACYGLKDSGVPPPPPQIHGITRQTSRDFVCVCLQDLHRHPLILALLFLIPLLLPKVLAWRKKPHYDVLLSIFLGKRPARVSLAHPRDLNSLICMVDRFLLETEHTYYMCNLLYFMQLPFSISLSFPLVCRFFLCLACLRSFLDYFIISLYSWRNYEIIMFIFFYPV